MRLYWEVARRALQRQLAYRTENLAGLVTNTFFGYLRGALFLAVYQGQSTTSIAGYDVHAAVSFMWITQAMIMIVALWGWWDVEETIRNPDVTETTSSRLSYLKCLPDRHVMLRVVTPLNDPEYVITAYFDRTKPCV